VYESVPSAVGGFDEPVVTTHVNDEFVPETDPVWNVTPTPVTGLMGAPSNWAVMVAVSGVASDTVDVALPVALSVFAVVCDMVAVPDGLVTLNVTAVGVVTALPYWSVTSTVALDVPGVEPLNCTNAGDTDKLVHCAALTTHVVVGEPAVNAVFTGPSVYPPANAVTVTDWAVKSFTGIAT